MNFSKCSLVLFSLLLFQNCSRKVTYFPTNVKFELSSVTALDLEEDGYWLSTGQDEIYTIYSIVSLNRENRIVDKKFRKYGPSEFSYRGESQYGYERLNVNIPADGKLYIGFQLIEDDDYSSESSAIDNSKMIVDVANKIESIRKKPNKFRMRGYRFASRTLNWLGVAVTLIDIFDTNDNLMACVLYFDEHDLQDMADGWYISKSKESVGSNYGDRYHYKVDYKLIAKRIFGETVKVKPRKKEKIKKVKKEEKEEKIIPLSQIPSNVRVTNHPQTKPAEEAKSLPNFVLGFNPFVGTSISNYWISAGDKFRHERGGATLYDRLISMENFGADLSFPLMKSKSLKDNRGIRYNISLKLGYQTLNLQGRNDENTHLGNVYFDGNDLDRSEYTFNNSNIKIDHYTSYVKYGIYMNHFFIDLGMGIIYSNADLSFDNLQSPMGLNTETYRIIDGKIVFGMDLNIGWGFIGNGTGFIIKGGAQLPDWSKLLTTNEYSIFEGVANDLDPVQLFKNGGEEVQVKNDKWRVEYNGELLHQSLNGLIPKEFKYSRRKVIDS